MFYLLKDKNGKAAKGKWKIDEEHFKVIKDEKKHCEAVTHKDNDEKKKAKFTFTSDDEDHVKNIKIKNKAKFSKSHTCWIRRQSAVHLKNRVLKYVKIIKSITDFSIVGNVENVQI